MYEKLHATLKSGNGPGDEARVELVEGWEGGEREGGGRKGEKERERVRVGGMERMRVERETERVKSLSTLVYVDLCVCVSDPVFQTQVE